MHLKKALWSEAIITNDSSESPTTSSSSSSAVDELTKSLHEERVYREVTLALRSCLRDARAEFSFLRVKGLRSLLQSLRSFAHSDSSIRLFSLSQSIPDFQVIPVLFQHSLKDATEDEKPAVSLDHIFSVDPVKITSSSTAAEVSLALRVLEGCCLLHRESTVLAHKHNAVPVLMNILSTRGVLEQGACVDALISIMLDSSANQMEFKHCHGIEEVAELIRDKRADENLRLKCGEFLLLLIGHVNEREQSTMASINEEIRRLLGEKSASLIWAASQFGSTLDPEQRLTALHIQARRVLESLDLY